MLTRAEHVETVAAQMTHVPEIAELVDMHRRLVDAVDRVVAFHSTAYRPPGRLGDLLDALAAATTPAPDSDDPAAWDSIEWRRRCADAGVPQTVLLRHAVDLAHAAGIPRPHALHDIDPAIAADLAAHLTPATDGKVHA